MLRSIFLYLVSGIRKSFAAGVSRWVKRCTDCLIRYEAKKAAGPHSDEMDPELRTVILGEEADSTSPPGAQTLTEHGGEK